MSSKWLKGAAWLFVAGVIGKVLSAGYRIPLQNLGGDVGFYVYQQIYPIIGIGIVFALQGIPAAVSRVIADGASMSISSFYIPILTWLSAFFFALAAIGYASASSIAGFMGDEQLTSSLEASFLIFLVVPFLAALRGIFQGKEDMKTSAVSQLIEQFVRVVGILIASAAAYMIGDVYLIGTGTATAVVTGMVLSCIYLGWKWSRNAFSTKGKESIPRFFYVRRVVFYSLLIGINYMLMLLLQLADAFTFVPLLTENGYKVAEAREWKGVYDRAQPLIQLVLVLASSVALSLLPAVVRADNAKQAVAQAMTITLLISTAACVGLLVLFPEINRLFYLDTSGTGVLRLQMVNVILVSIAVTSASALQGLGYVGKTAAVICGGLIVKVIGNVILIPHFHEYGAALASIFAAGFIVIIHVQLLKRKLHRNLFIWRKGRLLPALLGMAGVIGMLQSVYSPDSRLVLLGWVLVLSGAGAFLYGFLLRQFRTVPDTVVPSEWRKWIVKEDS
ncbi:putative polysaccharide biosynthesis protein [Salimicrobium halophilum]|uniref:Polysaccharide transporter, PST family n=1 Tax=Salimicrobium halophilum TaxID=86666 RepID=A0A1G8W354_9BACI|nr:polysaccharide biosynthesis protein [Salimicrobium halophilum]SDJ72513.1 polysaccharide transporter, PST family [Salimicrobium halophilum]